MFTDRLSPTPDFLAHPIYLYRKWGITSTKSTQCQLTGYLSSRNFGIKVLGCCFADIVVETALLALDKFFSTTPAIISELEHTSGVLEPELFIFSPFLAELHLKNTAPYTS